MQQNVGSIDSGVRIVLGWALLAWIVIGQGDARWLALIGVVLLATGVAARCPAYLPFGIRTRGKR